MDIKKFWKLKINDFINVLIVLYQSQLSSYNENAFEIGDNVSNWTKW